MLECPACKKTFADDQLLHWHMFYHEGLFKKKECWCGKPIGLATYAEHFDSVRNLDAHYHSSVLGVNPCSQER